MSTSITSYLSAEDLQRTLRRDVREGLTATPKTLPPTWFYDERGSLLFDDITRLPEYYPTRTERAILAAHVDEIAAESGADTVIELGSGTSDKTRLLLQALTDAGTLRRFVPFDVDPTILTAATVSIGEQFPDIDIDAVVGDFTTDLKHLADLPPGPARRLVVFLGSTIGNLEPEARAQFLTQVAAILRPGDGLLLGTDLVKDPDRLIRAYDDSAGVTAEFNRNVLRVIDAALHADFDLDTFEHVAVWDAELERIEMRLRSLREQTVRVADLGLDVHFAAGEDLRTEISSKFRRERVAAELEAAGLTLRSWWTDPDGDFGLSLATR